MQATEDSLKANNSSNSGATEPSYKENGSPWYNTNDDTMNFYVDGAWVAIAGGGSGNVVGEVREFAMSAPALWVACDGSAISRATYSALFAAIGTTFGIGDGSTTFNVPNRQDNVGVGAGSTYALGATGGAATHQLTEAEMPSHSHTVTRSQIAASGSGTSVVSSSSPSSTPATSSTGGDTAHNNMQPYIALNYAIYAGV